MSEGKINNGPVLANQDKAKDASAATAANAPNFAFWLVVIMLGILFILAGLLLLCPFLLQAEDKLLDYYKWALSVLLGAFGAWIGAGAAYFFGKESLRESSRSTENALEIQQRSFRRPSPAGRIRDLILTGMNANFMFKDTDSKGGVLKKLQENRGYWFVPVIDNEGVLRDIIHAQVFWDSSFETAEALIKNLIPAMDAKGLTKLHGDSFYVKVSLNDSISDASALMNRKGAEVGIIVDEKGKPTHCFSKTDLRSVLAASDRD